MTTHSVADPSPACSFLHNWIAGLVAILLLACLSGCQSSDNGDEDANTPPVVEITAADYAFAAPDTIPSGWVTFRMTNDGTESHHFHLNRLPEGRTVAEWREDAKEPADSIFQLHAEGKIDLAEVGTAIDQATASWTDSVQTHGGVGLVAPDRTGQATHRVEPGHYVMVCVIRAPSGLPHAALGMVKGIVAVESSAGRSPPESDVTVRGVRGEIRMDDTLISGRRTVGFRVKEVPEGLREGTDGYYSVWLARLDDTTDTSDVTAWDARNPAPFEGLGGFEYLPPAQAAYMTADVQPGRYAWIWFYAGMDVLGDEEPMVKTFTVE